MQKADGNNNTATVDNSVKSDKEQIDDRYIEKKLLAIFECHLENKGLDETAKSIFLELMGVLNEKKVSVASNYYEDSQKYYHIMEKHHEKALNLLKITTWVVVSTLGVIGGTLSYFGYKVYEDGMDRITTSIRTESHKTIDDIFIERYIEQTKYALSKLYDSVSNNLEKDIVASDYFKLKDEVHLIVKRKHQENISLYHLIDSRGATDFETFSKIPCKARLGWLWLYDTILYSKNSKTSEGVRTFLVDNIKEISSTKCELSSASEDIAEYNKAIEAISYKLSHK